MSTSDQQQPSVSAVVINYNGGERIIRTIQALLDQPHTLQSIVLVDNASTDDTPDRIREQFPQVRVHDMGGNLGLPVARNTGLRMVESDLVLLLDNDVYVTETTIARLVEAQRETGAAVACPRIRLLPERDTVQAQGAEAHFLGTMTLLHAYTPIETAPATRREVGGCIGACYLVDRQAVLDAGGFDETFFFYFEDLEFCIRMRALGHKFVCEPAAEVFHERGAGTPGLSFRGRGAYPKRRMYLSMRHRLLTMFVHYRLRTLIALSPALALYEFASLTLAIVRGFGWQWFGAWGWIIAHVGLIRQKRRAVQRRRRLRDGEIYAGGPIPLAPGLIRNRLAQAAVNTLSRVCNGYWRLARPLIG